MEWLEEKVRVLIANASKCCDGDEDSPEERAVGDYSHWYLYFHHGGFYFALLAKTALTDSFLSDCPWFFYYALFFFCLSLDIFTNTRKTPPGWVTKEPENTEGLYFCAQCKLHCPLRAGHCRVCGKCVMRRDHHCPWIGMCVGRDNHLYFYLWIWCEFLVMLPFCVGLFGSLWPPKPQLEWIGALALFVFCGFDLFMVFWLIFTQTAMILANVTQWEVARRSRISYLKDYPLGMNPFDLGYIGNIKEFVSMGFTHKEWTSLPVPDVAQFEYERECICHHLGIDGDHLVTQGTENRMHIEGM